MKNFKKEIEKCVIHTQILAKAGKCFDLKKIQCKISQRGCGG
jgi:hypothetical protein